MRKRIGALGLSAVLLLAMICPALAANGKAELSLKGPEGPIKAGESFTVTVEIKDNPGFGAMQFTVSFGTKALDYAQTKTGDVLNGAMSESAFDAMFGATLAAISESPLTKDGTIAELSLSAKEDIPALRLELSDVLIYDDQGNELSFTVSNPSAVAPETPSETSETLPSESKPSSESVPTPMPSPAESESQLEPTPEFVKENTFTDTKGHWAESFISRAAELGLFKGYEDGCFKPNVDVTRAQYVTVLYRMAGSPAVSTEAPFTDIIGQNQEFRTAIAWGYENGYLNGKGEGVFDPNGSVTRQEAMKILFGYDGGVSGMEVMFTEIYDKTFTDSDQIAGWGKPAMYWGVFKSLISGTSETTLSPKGTATRAQLAKILTSYYDLQNQ